MTDEYEVVRGLPDEEELLGLLCEAFGNWGDEAFLRWKYDRPGVEPATGYHVVRNGELAAFRGMFERTIEGPGGGYDCHVCGDACVAEAHRGEGLYSRIRDATESDIERSGSDFCGIFTRKGHIPFEVGLDRGWKYRTLPLYLRVLSPGNVIPHYARLVLDEDGTAADLLDRLGGRVTLRSGGESLRLDRLLGESKTESGWSVPVPFPEWATTAAVEAAGTDSLRESLKRRTPIGRPGTTDRSASAADVEVSVERSVGDDLLESLATLYVEATAEYDLAFRREADDLRHLLAHPRLLGVVTARRDGTVVGAAPVALTETEDTLEAWVLDLVAADGDVRDALVAGIEEAAIERDADMALLLSDADPGTAWAQIDRQVLMWTSYGADTRSLETDSLFMGLYDVV
ncbi:GNAT family N-acetyltransferase [Halorubrum depositum]|uniref:GNAT family N-acetyltransferase n=1 Tax=Halorubrum depositum TaxID=2583992 RepID=UPI0011A82D4C|nr:GNAT family N-acetyltransferase [Halorubrum depositum]